MFHRKQILFPKGQSLSSRNAGFIKSFARVESELKASKKSILSYQQRNAEKKKEKYCKVQCALVLVTKTWRKQHQLLLFTLKPRWDRCNTISNDRYGALRTRNWHTIWTTSYRSTVLRGPKRHNSKAKPLRFNKKHVEANNRSSIKAKATQKRFSAVKVRATLKLRVPQKR